MIPRTFRTSVIGHERFRRARRGVLAMVGMVVIVNLSVGVAAEVYPRIRDPFYGDKLIKLQRRCQHNTINVVMLGTSRTGFGFHGQRVEQLAASEGTTIRAFNFGIPASGPVIHLLYTQRLLRDGVRPKILLVELLPSMYSTHRGGFETHWLHGDRLLHHELDHAVRLGFDRRKLYEEWRTTTFLPWYGLRFQLLGRLVSSWIPWQIRYDWSRGTDAWGWGTPIRDSVTADERSQLIANAKAEYQPVLDNWAPNPNSVQALHELLTVCRRNSIEPIVVLMPEGSSFRSWYPPVVRDRLTSLLNSIRQECRVVDAQDWLPDEAFYDDHHQFRRGAQVFTERLTQDVILPAIRGQNR